jgi:hypothetical protein
LYAVTATQKNFCVAVTAYNVMFLSVYIQDIYLYVSTVNINLSFCMCVVRTLKI